MYKRKRIQSTGRKRKGGRKGKFSSKREIAAIKPGIDNRLEKVFASIGIPEKRKFKPDPFQLKAVSTIKTEDCLVTAPTGAGKTWIAIKAIERIQTQGGRSWYASPLKALTNIKFQEFSNIFGPENVGILTGDRKENPDGSIITGTTEILRNQLYDAMHHGEELSFDLVILDEAHFLGDAERGVVWEEIMIYLPSRIPLLLLSATIGNARDIADWLSSLRQKKCRIVEETSRPVPLFPLFFHPSGTLLPLFTGSNFAGKGKIYKKVNNFLSKKRPLMLAPPHKLPPFGEIIQVLNKYHLLPAIFFLKSRKDCDNAIKMCHENYDDSPEKRSALDRMIKDISAKNPHIAHHRQLRQLKKMAVGAHHSGQLPIWKIFIETMMNEGLLRAVFATSTVAAGVNFPARTVVFFNSDRFNGREFLPLNPTEFHQMTGRAGRRGMDNIGFALAIPGKFMDIRLSARLVNSPPSNVLSQIKINFSMVLNLLLSHTTDQIEELLEKSFAAWWIMKREKKKSAKIYAHSKNKIRLDYIKHLNFLKDNGFVSADGLLTGDGIWAAKLRVDQPLVIAEGFRLGVFPASEPALLAAVMASFVNEKESDDRISSRFLSEELIDVFFMIKKALKPFSGRLAKKGFEVRPLFLRPSATIYAWATGFLWDDVLSVAEIAEGDLVMLVLRTADNLRHIKGLSKIFPESSRAASEAIDLIMRDPVISELS